MVTKAHNPAFDEGRKEPTRQEDIFWERQSRDNSTINRFLGSRLNFLRPEQLDHKNFKYHWTNDFDGRIPYLISTDWRHVPASHIKNFNESLFDSESPERLRKKAGTNRFGQVNYAYLMYKPKHWWMEDQKRIEQNHKAELEQKKHNKGADPVVNISTEEPVPHVRSGSII